MKISQPFYISTWTMIKEKYRELSYTSKNNLADTESFNQPHMEVNSFKCYAVIQEIRIYFKNVILM